MKTFTTLLWLRWHLFRNEHSKQWVTSALFTVFIVMFASMGMGMGFLFRHVEVTKELRAASEWVGRANLLLGAFVAFIVLTNLVGTSRIMKPLPTAPLRHLPLPRLPLFVLIQLIGAINVMYFVYAAIFLGFVTGLGVLTSSVSAAFACTVYACAAIMGLHCVTEILRQTIENAQVLSLRMKLVLGVGLALLFGGMLRVYHGDIWGAAIAVTPVGWMNGSLWTLVFAHLDAGLFPTVGMTLVVVACEMAVLFMLLALDRVLIQQHQPRNGELNLNGEVKTQLLFYPHNLIPFVVKDLLSLCRSKAIQSQYWKILAIFGIVLFGSLFGFFTLHGAMAMFYLLFMPLILWDPIIGNIFGMDRIAFGAYLMLQTPPRVLVISKNISHAILILPSLMLSWILVALTLPPWRLPLFVLAQCAIYGVLCNVGNFRSLRSPAPLLRNEDLNSATQRQKLSGELIYTLIISSACTGIISYFTFFWTNLPGCYGALILIIGAAGFIYRQLLGKWSSKFYELSESIYAKLRQS